MRPTAPWLGAEGKKSYCLKTDFCNCSQCHPRSPPGRGGDVEWSRAWGNVQPHLQRGQPAAPQPPARPWVGSAHRGAPGDLSRLETEGGWKLFTFCQEKVSNVSSQGWLLFFFGFFFRQLCLGLFVSEAGFLNHPKQTKRNGAMTRYPNKERFCWARFTPSSAHQSLYFPWHTSGGRSLATAPSLQHQLGTACLQASRCQISAP